MSRIHVRVKTIEDKIAEYVENNPVDIYVDYRDELSDKQVDLILEGRGDEVRNEIEMEYDSWGEDWDELCSEVGCSRDDVDDWLSDDGFYPSHSLSDSSWRQLLSNTTANIVGIVWDAEWNFNNWAYGQPLEYSDVKETLRILGVNPAEFKALKTGGSRTMGDGQFKGYFPNIPSREPKVNVKDLYDNMIVLYDGVLHFCLGNLENIDAILSSDSKYLVFEKGTNVVMYDRMNGAGITEVQLTGDIKIKRSDVDFKNDTNNEYGIQSCYGFVQSFWTEGSVRNA